MQQKYNTIIMWTKKHIVIISNKFFGGTDLQMLFRDNNWATLGDACTRSLTVAMWIISFPKVLIGFTLPYK